MWQTVEAASGQYLNVMQSLRSALGGPEVDQYVTGST
jgi:hypothetical protein